TSTRGSPNATPAGWPVTLLPWFAYSKGLLVTKLSPALKNSLGLAADKYHQHVEQAASYLAARGLWDEGIVAKYRLGAEKLLAGSEWQGDCLVWIGPRTRRGYGQV